MMHAKNRCRTEEMATKQLEVWEGGRNECPTVEQYFRKKLKESRPWNKGSPGTDKEKLPQRYADMSKTFSKCNISLSIYFCPEDGKECKKCNYFNHFVSWKIISRFKENNIF